MSGRRAIAVAISTVALILAGCAPGAGGRQPTSTPPSATPAPSGVATQPSGAIRIDEPGEGETVRVPFTTTGASNTFEAALTIDVVDESGTTLCVRHLTATAGSGEIGTWEGALAFPPQDAAQSAMLRAYTFSPKDGSMTDLVERRVTVSPERPDIVLTAPRCGDVYAAGTAIPLLGTAAVFEAALTVELRDTRGEPVVSVPVTAEECCVESSFSSTLEIPEALAPGWYDVVAYSLSAKDGSVIDEFPVQVEITG